jgi:hypothetical protein
MTGTVKCGHREVQNSDDWFQARRINQESDGYLKSLNHLIWMGLDGIIPGLLQCAVPHLNLPSAIYFVSLSLGCTLETWQIEAMKIKPKASD